MSMSPRSCPHMATRIPNARVVELPGRNTAPPLGDQEPLFAELERFLSVVPEGEAEFGCGCGCADHVRDSERAPEESSEAERVLATVLFTDIVANPVVVSGQRARASADRREVDTAGDGFFA